MRTLLLSLVMTACAPELPDGTLGCSDGICPPGFHCGMDERCHRGLLDGGNDGGRADAAIDRDGATSDAPDGGATDGATDGGRDAGPEPGLHPRWLRVLAGPGEDEIRACTILADGTLVVGGRVDTEATLAGAPLASDANRAFVGRLSPEGDLVEASVWPMRDGVSRVNALATDGVRVFGGGRFTGNLASGEASRGAFDGWVGEVDDTWRTITHWEGAAGQAVEALSYRADQLLAVGTANTELIVGETVQLALGTDGAITVTTTSGVLDDVRLVSSGPGLDRLTGAAIGEANGRYVAGRRSTDPGVESYLSRVGVWEDAHGNGGFSDARAVVSRARNDACIGGHHDGTLDFGEGGGEVAAQVEAGYVACYDQRVVDWVVRFDGTASDRVHALAIDGVLVAAGVFLGTQDNGFGPHIARAEDVFLGVLDPFTGTLLADGVVSGSGNVVVTDVAVRSDGSSARVYVVGRFDGSVGPFAGATLPTQGDIDGFVAAFDFTR